jgi:hypothetical protein
MTNGVIHLRRDRGFSFPEGSQRAEQAARLRGEDTQESDSSSRRRRRRRRDRDDDSDVINLQTKPKEKSLAFKAGEKIGKVLTSPKTTVALGLTAAALATGGSSLAAGAGGRATITRTATALDTVARGTSVTTQRAFTGRTINTGINKIFHSVRPIAARFATNTKSIGLTNSFLGKFLTNPGTLLASIGTYPFAGFIKEEAVQQTGFAFSSAERNQDLEGMQLAIQETEEIINAAPGILDAIPFANVLKQLKGYFEAVAVKLNQDKRTLSIVSEGIENPEESFEDSSNRLAGERRERELSEDAEDRQTQLDRRAEDQAFFDEVRNQNEERQQQTTFFFEALRKRNAGIRLTEEEIAALEARGVSRDLLGQSNRERSTVQF